MLDTIEADMTYDHEKHGEVLVTAVGEMYDEYSVSRRSGEPNSRLVFFYTRFDGYGGMNPAPMSEPVNEFARDADRIGPHEHVGSDLRE
jgi:hypothetical protein